LPKEEYKTISGKKERLETKKESSKFDQETLWEKTP